MQTPNQARRIRFGPFEVDLRSRELRKHGARVRLQEQPFRVLAMLLERPGELVTRDELRSRLWPKDTFVDFDVGLNTAIKRLRDALNERAGVPRYIETLPRRGYRFIAPVEETEPPVVPPVMDYVPTGGPEPAQNGTERGNFFRPLWVSAVVVAGLLAIVFGLKVGGRRKALDNRPARPLIQSIAVLPFDNLTGDPAQELFADGMTDALTTSLAKIRTLRVVSRTSAMHYKKTTLPLAMIARDLHVDGVVEGSVVRSGNRLRITVQLIEVANDRHLWAESYERDLRDVLELQDEVVREIVEQVQAEVTR